MFRKNKNPEKIGARARNTPIGTRREALTNEEHSRTRSVRIYVLPLIANLGKPRVGHPPKNIQPIDRHDNSTMSYVVRLKRLYWPHEIIFLILPTYQQACFQQSSKGQP